MDHNFNALGISSSIIQAIEEMGFASPTEVQYRAIPHILKGEDLIVMSKTGSGKTGAFGIPILQTLDTSGFGPQALILTPTRELAVQVDSDLRLMSKHLALSTMVVYGQHNMNVEIQGLKKGSMILTGTPGRVFDHIRQGNFITKNIKFLVLDEADRMLDMGFIDQVVRIIKTLPKNRVTLLFSATMPAEIQKICKEYMKQPTTIELESDTKTVDTIKQVYYRVDHNDKRTQLDRILNVEQPDSCMIFCNTRAAVDKVNAFLLRKGYTSDALHGANTQSSRMRTIQQFKNGAFQILVATDVAARGIHIEDLSLVINYDLPVEKDSYVHRIGRTGRAGNGGRAITLVGNDELMSLYDIEEHVGTLIEEEDLPSDAYVLECIQKASGKWAQAKASFVYKPKPPHVEKAKPHHGDRTKSAHSDKPRPAHGDRAKPAHAERPKAAHVDRPKPAHADKPKPVHADRPKPVHAERPKPVRQEPVKAEPVKAMPHKAAQVEKPQINLEKTPSPTPVPAVKKSAFKKVKDFIIDKLYW